MSPVLPWLCLSGGRETLVVPLPGVGKGLADARLGLPARSFDATRSSHLPFAVLDLLLMARVCYEPSSSTGFCFWMPANSASNNSRIELNTKSVNRQRIRSHISRLVPNFCNTARKRGLHNCCT